MQMAYDDDHDDDHDDDDDDDDDNAYDDHNASSHCQSKALLLGVLRENNAQRICEEEELYCCGVCYIYTCLARFKVCFSTENEDDCQPVTVFVEGCKMPVIAIALRREFKKFTFIVWRGVVKNYFCDFYFTTF
uniref:Uncharacterized protein n=1 Tax=Glossina brevipalpis TaxID=37001 RepID=A0A1A9WI07_9MUSC